MLADDHVLIPQHKIQLLFDGNPYFETILKNIPEKTALITSEENYCPDCHDCDYNCEECDNIDH